MQAFIARQFAKAGAAPNTFIGGIAKTGGTGVNAPIDTPWKLSQKLNIAVNRISGFRLVGDDVECRIRGSYELPGDVFLNNTNITSYMDNGQLVTVLSGQAFRNSTNLADISFEGATAIIGTRTFENTKIKTAYFPALTSVNTGETIGSFYNNHLLESISTPILTGVGLRVWGANLLMDYDAPLITQIGNLGLRGCPLLTPVTGVNLDNIVYVRNESFGGSFPVDTDLTMPELLTVGTNALSGNRIRSFIAPKLTALTGGSTFSGGSRYELIDIKKCKQLGNSTGDNNTFLNLKTGCTINVNIFLATADAGNPDADLLYAKNDRGAIVNFYDDNGDYVSTL